MNKSLLLIFTALLGSQTANAETSLMLFNSKECNHIANSPLTIPADKIKKFDVLVFNSFNRMDKDFENIKSGDGKCQNYFKNPNTSDASTVVTGRNQVSQSLIVASSFYDEVLREHDKIRKYLNDLGDTTCRAQISKTMDSKMFDYREKLLNFRNNACIKRN